MSPQRPLRTVDRIEEIPSFADEAEEHAFWATHELSDTLWDQAEPLQPDELPTPTAPVVIRLDHETLGRVKALARHRRKRYRDVLAELVRAGIDRADIQSG